MRTAQIQSAAVLVFLAVLFILVEIVVVVVILVVFVLVPVFVIIFFFRVFLGLGARPAFRLLGKLQVKFRPAVDVEFLDIPVEMLNLNGFSILVHLEHLERFLVFQVLIPLTDGRFVLSAHDSPIFERAADSARRILGEAACSSKWQYCDPMTAADRKIIAHRLTEAKRVVVKVGSTLLVDGEKGRLNRAWLEGFAEDVVSLRKRGQDVILVSSGAIALGRRHLGLNSGKLKLEESQAAAAVGQIRLAHAYKELLDAHEITVAQILLTLGDTEQRRRYLNARSTLNTLLSLGAVPVINENDNVATSEIRYGDNDRLAARVAQMVGADCLILLSDIDGLYTANPNEDPDAEFIGRVLEITPAIEAMAGGAGSDMGSGGMQTKIAAAKIAVGAGCHLCIAKGAVQHPLQRIEEGARCTWFVPSSTPMATRKQWIAGTLLPAGVTRAMGRFDRGDTVSIIGPDGSEVARGICAYSDGDAARIIGRRSGDIEKVLGFRGRDEIVHRDDLVLIRAHVTGSL